MLSSDLLRWVPSLGIAAGEAMMRSVSTVGCP
jgi:hypothetical protein